MLAQYLRKHLIGHFLMNQRVLGLVNLELVNRSVLSDTKISIILQDSVEKHVAAKIINSPM